MLSPIQAHQKGLDEGMEIALKMINEALGTQAKDLGQAIAHIEIMNRRLKYLREDYDAILQDIKQEKRYA